MNWLRIFHEARNDAKLRILNDSQFRVWFNLLLYSSEQKERGSILDYDSFLLALEVSNGDEELLHETLCQLDRLRIIHATGSEIHFLHFAERQYDKPSDRPSSVKERVDRFRNAKKGVTSDTETPLKRDVTRCNATEQNRTDSDTEKRGGENTARECASTQDTLPEAPPSPKGINGTGIQPQYPKAPTLESVKKVFDLNGRPELAERFYSHYASIGWVKGRAPIVDWGQLVKEWIDREDKFIQERAPNVQPVATGPPPLSAADLEKQKAKEAAAEQRREALKAEFLGTIPKENVSHAN